MTAAERLAGSPMRAEPSNPSLHCERDRSRSNRHRAYARQMVRTDAELKRQSLDVFWYLRQVLHLSAYLEQRRREGTTVLAEPLDAAALAAFAISARALSDFFWRDREPSTGPRPRSTDAFVVDWLTRDEWDPGDLPTELSQVHERVGQDIAHISFRRLDRTERCGWQPLEVAHRLAYWFAVFAQEVERLRPGAVASDFKREAWQAHEQWQLKTATEKLFEYVVHPPPAMATPVHPTDIGSLR